MNTKYIAMSGERTLESLPIDPTLLERANWWFDISWYGLLWAGGATAVAACATVTFLFIQFWSGNIRERQADWRTSALEVQTKRAEADLTRAKADIAGAEARAAEANQIAEQERLARTQLEARLAPRTISADEQKAISKKLESSHGTTTQIYIFSGGTDTTPFAHLLHTILQAAQWDAGPGPWTVLGPAYVNGVLISTMRGSDATSEQAANLLVQTLNEFGIAAARYEAFDEKPQWATVGPPPANTIPQVIIMVGSKPQ
ncbi:MAG: hypothetical protein WB760_18630 [Xanthobacteraceae bacterium]